MASDEGNKPKTSFDLRVGKEIDAALGDIIRGLLKKPAEQAGNLLADGIGIFSDRVRRKRELNAQLGMEEVRIKLDAGGIDMQDITPPNEEELHLLMNGLSLTDDESVRDIWAGLFAKALEPNSSVTAERSFLSVLGSLSPMDAKIIHFLAYAAKELEALSKSEKWGGPIFLDQESPDMIEELTRRSNVIANIEALAHDYSLAPPASKNWPDNLLRQGVIEIPPAVKPYWPGAEIRSMDDDEIERAFQDLNDKVREMEKASETQKPEELYYVLNYGVIGAQFNFRVQLSSFGRSLCEACGLL